ncbi:LysR family transcriptional regulator [Paenibacillus nasutitermitis]|uniref:HTH-type transcriptional regulator YwbI n=1 Tax=Paenibacillus nasutitermitis TaxID=1652958 RepID=A0A917E031_9BACL|nr:LysR family transcriptional regulator [Paenibacillus nasutitermitis]GGD89524.1 putative HTH-type transcriptional regulator YwbI [Paenibacillus nasutitermitis]
MDIRHLQVVAEIVRQNSFTKAADSLHLTQPTISKTIRNLENELNVEVFIRDGKTLKLTDAGTAIMSYAGPILQLFDKLQSEIHDLTYLNKGRISIGLPPMAGARFFPGVIKSFQERYPGIAIQMVEEGSNKIEESIATGELDVGVVLGPVDGGVFDSFPVIDEVLKVILHPSNALAGKAQIRLSELAQEKFILFSSDFALHDRIITECRAVGYSPRIEYESTQWDFIGEMVASDLGIAMLPATICRSFNPAKVRSVPLIEPSIPWSLDMVWKREGYLSLAAREWIAFTRHLFA